MYIGYDEKQEALRRELRRYYAELLTPEVEEGLARERGAGPLHREIVRRMGRDGWLCLGWPVEYGGQGRGEIDQFIFYDESMRAGAPVPMLTTNTVGPTLMRYGSEAQKKFFLPKIAAGEIHFCIGYSEPNAGTDLAALQTRAERQGDVYVVNGQKLWTSLAGDADYCWLAARTDPQAPKHQGISLLIVDLKNTPGIRVDPLELAETRLRPTMSNWNIAAQRKRNSWRLLVDDADPFVTVPKRCTFASDAGERFDHELNWRTLSASDLNAQMRIAIGRPNADVSLAPFGDGWWLRLGTLVDDARPVVEEVAARAAELRSGRFVIVDLRGNGASSASDACVRT